MLRKNKMSTTVTTTGSVPQPWLYWTLHIVAWVIGVAVPVVLFFVAKSKDEKVDQYGGPGRYMDP